jgi:hypothetical protein
MPPTVGDPVASAFNVPNYRHFESMISIATDLNHDVEDNMLASMPESIAYTIGLHSMHNYEDFVLGCDLLDAGTQCK